MTTHPDPAQPPGPSGLTIGELARRTGVAAPTLRMWETRHGFPRAHRLASGHRRYDERDVDQVLAVLRGKTSGLSLAAAIAAVVGRADVDVSSVFAALRERHPHQLAPYPLRKRTVTALAHAMEDECCARAQRPWLLGAFQQERFYRAAEARWRDFARTAAGACVLAEFDEPRADRVPVEIALAPAVPMHREWVLICLAPDLPVCLSAWELPGQSRVPDAERRFEVLWSLEPDVVLDAARSFAAVLGEAAPAGLAHALESRGYSASRDLGQASALFSRIVAYVDRSHS